MVRSWVVRAAAVVAATGIACGPFLARAAAADTGGAHERVPVIVSTSGALASRQALAAAARLGGVPGVRLPVIHGFAVDLPVRALPLLSALPGVVSIAPDRPVHLLSEGDRGDGGEGAAGEGQAGDSHDGEAGDGAREGRRHGEAEAASSSPVADPGAVEAAPEDDAAAPAGDPDDGSSPTWVSMASAIETTRASAYYQSGITGRGIDVALIDSGVALVHGLDAPGKVVDGPDFTTDVTNPDRAHRDRFGHGTHMAGIIAGTDSRPRDAFSGIAPGARIVNLKVADGQGRTDVSQVIAAIGWAVHHRDRDGLHIRVLNLSFGTDGGAEPALDPLDQAVEVAWRQGITVVVAAGNHGADAGHLANPARDPLVLAVGAADSLGSWHRSDDITVDFSSHGDGSRNPDLVAPGRSIVSLRDPGSTIDVAHEQARIGDRLFRGSGTSQSAAMVSGAVALVAEQHPEASPDQVKALLDSTAVTLPRGGDATAQGHGLLDLDTALGASLAEVATPAPDTMPDGHPVAVGQHGTAWHVSLVAGTIEISGDPFAGTSQTDVHTDEVSGDWDGSSWSGSSWSDGDWSGSSWSDDSW